MEKSFGEKKETNIHFLMKRYPLVKKALENNNLNKLPVMILKSESGYPTVKILKNDKWYPLHSIVNPLKEAEALIKKKLRDDNYDLIIVFGFGYGYHLREILKEYPEATIIIIEPIIDVLKYAINNDEILNLCMHQNIQIYIEESFSSIIPQIRGNIFKKISMVALPSYTRIFPEIANKIKSEISGFMENERINNATLKRFDRLWTKNILRNSLLFFTKPGINKLKNTFQNYPALIICGGPSAEKSFGLIKQFSDELCIIAVDTAVSPLIKRGLYPDFIVSVDPQYINSEGLGNPIQKLNNMVERKNKKPFLVIDPGIYPATAMNYKGPIFMSSSIFPPGTFIENLVEEKGKLAAGGSVSVAAFDLANLLGCNPIIVTGLDLSYKKTKTHISGSLMEEYTIKYQTRLKPYLSFISNYMIGGGSIKINLKKNETVYTDRRLLLYKNWFENNAININRKIINYSEGIPIKGFTRYSDKELISKLLKEKMAEGVKKNKQSIIQQILTEHNTYQSNHKIVLSYKSLIERWVKNIDEIQNKASEAIKILEKTLKLEKGIIENIKLLEEIDRNILQYKNENTLISMVMQNSIGQILEKNLNSKNWIENSKYLYNSIIESCSYLKYLLERTLKFIKLAKN